MARQLENGTYHFTWGKARSPPGGGICRSTVVTLATDSVAQLCSSIVSMDDIVGLSRVRLGRHVCRSYRASRDAAQLWSVLLRDGLPGGRHPITRISCTHG